MKYVSNKSNKFYYRHFLWHFCNIVYYLENLLKFNLCLTLMSSILFFFFTPGSKGFMMNKNYELIYKRWQDRQIKVR